MLALAQAMSLDLMEAAAYIHIPRVMSFVWFAMMRWGVLILRTNTQVPTPDTTKVLLYDQNRTKASNDSKPRRLQSFVSMRVTSSRSSSAFGFIVKDLVGTKKKTYACCLD